MAMQGWTDAEVSKLRVFWAEGMPTAEIGRRLFRLKNSVISKAHRLGLDGRPSCIVRSGERLVTRVKPTLPIMPSEAETPVHAPSKPAHAPGYAIRASVAARESHTPSIFDNVVYRPVRAAQPMLPIPTTKTCQWPMNDGAPAWLFCDEPATTRCYCGYHASVAYVGVRRIAA